MLNYSIATIVLLPFDIFKDAYIDTLVVTTKNVKPKNNHNVLAYVFPKKEKISLLDLSSLPIKNILQKDWETIDDHKFILTPDMLEIIVKIKSNTNKRLGDYCDMARGVLFNKNLLTETKTSNLSYRYFEGDVYRYSMNYFADNWIEYGKNMREYPREFKWFEGERILLRRLVSRKQRLMATIISDTVINNKNLYILKAKCLESILYMLGIINSLLISKIYISQVSQAYKDDFPQVTIKDLLNLPVPDLDISKPEDKNKYGKIIFLVQSILSLNEKLKGAADPQAKTVLQRRIEATDKEIDQLVYQLYSLTPEEIALLEKSV